jgi:hypothetical protein
VFPWGYPKQEPLTPREIFVRRLSEGVPPELAARAYGVEWDAVKDEREVVMALAEGEIMLFERARDSGVTGIVRAAMRREANSWLPKAEPSSGLSLEDYLRD